MKCRWPFWGLSALTGWLLLSGAAHARLGATRAECEQRYGASTGAVPSMVPGSDPEALRFHRRQTDITAHFKNGVVWHMTYAKGYLSDSEKIAALEENGDGCEWQPKLGEKVGNISVWRCQAADYAASFFEGVKLALLEVMTRACAEEIASQREFRIATAGEAR